MRGKHGIYGYSFIEQDTVTDKNQLSFRRWCQRSCGLAHCGTEKIPGGTDVSDRKLAI